MSTKIEWTQETWNPITGCAPISEGCANCYARRMANRLRGRFGYPKTSPFEVFRHTDKQTTPAHWRKPRRVFVCSMGDLMHGNVATHWIKEIIEVMSITPRHTYQILTKETAGRSCRELLGWGDGGASEASGSDRRATERESSVTVR